ncbi:phosphatidate cytidylyltransferase [Arthrobacter castelli]|uniref:phosphatidate cytidylyltransferase n=1 Tax=Arthrobacter castelli TaxID=271431 RepID=UPI00040191E2|nr:phosphatidate cytidylyltransferase [Arthrobacter castelli]
MAQQGPEPPGSSPVNGPGEDGSDDDGAAVRADRRSQATGRRALRAKVSPPKAGRNLPAAIAVGLALIVLVLVGLLIRPEAFVILVALVTVVGVWEVSRALAFRNIHLPLVPVMAGTIAMPFAAFYGGPESLGFAVVASAAAVLIWRALDDSEGAAGSILGGVFTLTWVPFLSSFAVLLLHEQDGSLKIATVLLLVVANDTFGYLVGVFFGRHPMAPKISPKKSWEGFAGSVAGAAVVGIAGTILLLEEPWWIGAVLAVSLVSAATMGDLAESMVKRELGIKDMSNILPGHGGVMDRLDSIVFAAPAAFVLMSLLLPGQV